jgi:hypothetical protein
MFSLFFLVLVIVTENIDRFEGVYFCLAIVDIAYVVLMCAVAGELSKKAGN